MTDFVPDFMPLAMVAKRISVGKSTIENWVKQGIFPPGKKIGGKRLWEWTVVRDHLALNPQLTAESDSELGDRIREATHELVSH